MMLFFVLQLLILPTCGQQFDGEKWINSPYCGLDTMKDSESRISGGSDAVDGQYPYFASLVDTEDAELPPFRYCGAAIIEPQVLLTAAHCLRNKEDLFRKGHIKALVRSTGPKDGSLIGLKHYVIHPDYSVLRRAGDLALIFTKDPIGGILDQDPDIATRDDRPLANTVCLPEDDTEFGEYVSFTTIGFGLTNDNTQPDRLQAANVSTPSPTSKSVGIDCRRLAKRCLPERNILLYNSDQSRARVCQGDSGSPLVKISSSSSMDDHYVEGGRPRATLAGIVLGKTHKDKGCVPTGSTVAARITFFMPWIRREVERYFNSVPIN